MRRYPTIAVLRKAMILCRSCAKIAVVVMVLFWMNAVPALGQDETPPPVIKKEKAATDGHVWGALVYAQNGKIEKVAATPEFPDVAKRLAKVFPFKSFEVLGQHNQAIFREYESWVVPSKDLFLKLDSNGLAKGGGIRLHVQFWQGQQVLVKSDTILHRDSPLFIGGPKWRDGRLVFVLLLKGVDATHGAK
jgi:hypothetical protein